MTLCIAAKCATCMGSPRPAIVLCADKRLETSSAGADFGFKFEDLGQGWVAMLSGTVAHALELCAQYRFHLLDKEITDHNVVDIFTEPAKGQLVKAEVSDLACDVLVCGFIDEQPYILGVDGQAEVTRKGHFATIGNGGYNADAMLHYRQQHSSMSFIRTLYHAYEAKVFSQSAPGVGEKTDVAFITTHGVCRFLNSKGLNYLESFRLSYGPQSTLKIPDEQLPGTFIATWQERRDTHEAQS